MTPPTPLAAFHVAPDGTVTAAGPGWPPPRNGYHWLHYDLTDDGTADWLAAHLPPTAAAALLQTETRPRCDLEGDGLILNLRAVNVNPGADPEDMVSMRLWVTPSVVVSGRMRRVGAADEVRERFDAGRGPATVGGFLALLTDTLARRIEEETLDLEEATDALEETILETTGDHGDETTGLRLTAIKLRRFVGPQREALYRLSTIDHPAIDAGACAALRETANRTTRSIEELDSIRDRLAAIQDHLDTEHARAIGRNGYILSVAAAVFLPLSFLTGLFGANLSGIPFAAHPWSFAGLTIASIAVGVLLFVLLRFLRFL